MDRERCVKAVTAHSDDAKIRGVRSVSVDVLPCNPAGGVAETIVEYCDMKRADLVVVGSSGAGSLRRLMLSLNLYSLNRYRPAMCPLTAQLLWKPLR